MGDRTASGLWGPGGQLSAPQTEVFTEQSKDWNATKGHMHLSAALRPQPRPNSLHHVGHNAYNYSHLRTF